MSTPRSIKPVVVREPPIDIDFGGEEIEYELQIVEELPENKWTGKVTYKRWVRKC